METDSATTESTTASGAPHDAGMGQSASNDGPGTPPPYPPGPGGAPPAVAAQPFAGMYDHPAANDPQAAPASEPSNAAPATPAQPVQEPAKATAPNASPTQDPAKATAPNESPTQDPAKATPASASAEEQAPTPAPTPDAVADNPALAAINGNKDAPDAADPKSPTAGMTPEQLQKWCLKQAETGQAMGELSGKLHVVDPNDPTAATGDKKPNDVSPEEFKRLAGQYADIKLGDTDLKINPSGLKTTNNAADDKAGAMTKDQFRNAAMQDIGTMMQTPSGRALLNGLTDNENDKGEHHTTTIAPLAKGDKVMDTETTPSGDANLSNRVGENATVRYSPGEGVMNAPGVPGVVTKSDAILDHELVHAYDYTHGQKLPGTVDNPTAPKDAKVGAEEYQAVGLRGKGVFIGGVPVSENDYRRDRRALGEDVPERTTYT